MKIALTPSQFGRIWNELYTSDNTYEIQNRINYWNEHIKPHFNLDYTECDPDLSWASDGWFGIISGDENAINWFMLHL